MGQKINSERKKMVDSS